MKLKCHPVVISKKILDTVRTRGEKKRYEVKTTQYFLPDIDIKTVLQFLKLLLCILIIIAVFSGKIKEVTPIVTSLLEQLP